jgi:hypothetical protein
MTLKDRLADLRQQFLYCDHVSAGNTHARNLCTALDFIDELDRRLSGIEDRLGRMPITTAEMPR